eukprot:1173974-Amphidinium_carterae.2
MELGDIRVCKVADVITRRASRFLGVSSMVPVYYNRSNIVPNKTWQAGGVNHSFAPMSKTSSRLVRVWFPCLTKCMRSLCSSS